MNKKSFLQLVQNSKVKSPTQRGFTVKKWKAAFDSSKDQKNEFDNNLFQAGLYFYKHLNNIRIKLSQLDDNLTSTDELRRLYTSIVNRDYLVADNAIKNNFDKMISKNELALLGSVSEQSLPIGPWGNDVHVLGSIEAHIDAVRYPLSDTFYSKAKKNGKTQINDLDFLNTLSVKINLASMYQAISEFWGECLWNHWKVIIKDSFDLISPPDSNQFKCKIVSQHRRETLQAESAYHVNSFVEKLSDEQKQALITKSVIVDIKKIGKTKKFILGKYRNETTAVKSILMSMGAEEIYWDELLKEKLPNYPELTIREILSAWEILSSLGRVLFERMPEDRGINKNKYLIQYAPKYKTNELLFTLQKATGFPPKKVKSILEFFMFNGKSTEDLWVKPIIPLDNDFFTALISPLIVTNRIRLIESWMKQGGIELDKRGYAYEAHVQKELKEDIGNSKHLKESYIHEGKLKIRIDGEEEIDFLWVINDLIIIGEIKCSLFPTTPLETHRFFNIIQSATEQSKRKAKFVEKNWEALLQKLQIPTPLDCKAVEVQPIVITNLVFGSGFSINDVPVTDLKILSRYIIGNQKFFVSNSKGQKEKGKLIIFYNSPEEAKRNIIPFLKEPHSIRLTKKLLDNKIEPLPRFDKEDKKVAWLRVFVNESLLKGSNWEL